MTLSARSTSVRSTLLTLAIFGAFSVHASAQQTGVLGTWREPGGAILRIDHCGTDVCATLVRLQANPPATVDAHNPDPALRTRRLCGLTIGTAFQPSGPDRAGDGRLYDPRSGKTYTGSMTAVGNSLDLRGYVLLKIFGRSETWTRTGAVVACAAE